MQDVSSISQRPPVNPTLQVHMKPVGQRDFNSQIIKPEDEKYLAKLSNLND